MSHPYRRPSRRFPATGSSSRSDLRPRCERLEPRKLLSASAELIREALDLDESVVVSYVGHPDAVGVFENYTVEGLLGMPSGPDGDFLVLSTASAYDAVRTTDLESWETTTRLRDLGDEGVDDDFARVNFTLTVPTGLQDQRLLIDFIYASDMDTDGGDFFDIFVNGINIANSAGGRIEAGGQYVTNERDPDIEEDVPGYGLVMNTEYSDLLKAVYEVPDGVTTLDIEIRIMDSESADFDAWALIDNIRFEQSQVVFLDFDGQLLEDFLLPGVDYDVDDFDFNDFGLGSDFAEVIQTDLEAIFADFDIVFVTEEPTEGEFMRVVVGGANRDELSIVDRDATEWLTRELGTDPTFEEFFNYTNFRNANGTEVSYGLADRLDLGNLDKGGTALVFAEQIGNDGYEYGDLVNTISHYIGRNLGLRAETNAATGSIMAEDIAERGGAFQDASNDFVGDAWGDLDALSPRQNAHAILLDVLGSSSDGEIAIRNTWTDARSLNQAHWTITPPTTRTLHDAQFIIIGDKHTRATITLVDEWTEEQVLITDFAGQDPQIVITAARNDGGRHTVETIGPRNLGQFTAVNDDAPVTIIGLWDDTGSSPVFQGSSTLIQTQANSETVYYTEYKFTDDDGDEITISFKSSTGLFSVEESSRGLVITIAESDPLKDKLTIKIKKSGDGIAQIAGIQGTGLKDISAKDASIVGTGIDLTSVDKIKLGSVADGSTLNVRQEEGRKGNHQITSIGDDAVVVFGREVSKLKLEEVGESRLIFDKISKLDVKGVFNALRLDIRDSKGANLMFKDQVTGGVWSFWGDDDVTGAKKVDFKKGATGLAITAESKIDNLKAKENLELDLTALAMAKFDAKGDYSGTMLLTDDGTDFNRSISKFTVKGIASDVLVQAMNSVDNIQIGVARDLRFYVGWDLSVTDGVPVDSSLLTNPDAKVKKLQIKGVRNEPFDMENAVFSAASFDKASLGDINGNNFGEPFGISAMEIKKIDYDTGTGKQNNKGDDSFNDNDTSDDFYIGRVV